MSEPGDDRFDRFVFDDARLAGYTTTPQLSFDEMAALLTRISQSRKRLLVAPSRLDEIRGHVQRAGLWVEVVASPLLNDDQAVLIPSEAQLQADMQQAFQAEMLADFRRETAALAAELREEIEEKARQERLRRLFPSILRAPTGI